MRATSIGLAETLNVGIPTPLWYALWEGTDHTDRVYKDGFRRLYHLEIVTIEGEDGSVEVVRSVDGDLAFWGEVGLFILTPGGACLDGCQQSRLPFE